MLHGPIGKGVEIATQLEWSSHIAHRWSALSICTAVSVLLFSLVNYPAHLTCSADAILSYGGAIFTIVVAAGVGVRGARRSGHVVGDRWWLRSLPVFAAVVMLLVIPIAERVAGRLPEMTTASVWCISRLPSDDDPQAKQQNSTVISVIAHGHGTLRRRKAARGSVTVHERWPEKEYTEPLVVDFGTMTCHLRQHPHDRAALTPSAINMYLERVLERGHAKRYPGLPQQVREAVEVSRYMVEIGGGTTDKNVRIEAFDLVVNPCVYLMVAVLLMSAIAVPAYCGAVLAARKMSHCEGSG